ncbi:response regulator [bacterium]|nr:response regulator [bacterium]
MKEKSKILIIDDEPSIREMLNTYLSRNDNYLIFEAGDIRETTEILKKEENIDIVFLDIQLPGVHGIEILKMLKKYDDTVNVVMMSGYATEEMAIESLKQGAYDYLKKPFDLTQVDSILASIEISDIDETDVDESL